MNFIITGSTLSIGNALAKYFLQNGHHVLINGTSPKSIDDALNILIPIYGNRVLGYASDTYSLLETQKMFSFAVAQFGNTNVVIANAGVNQHQLPFKEMDMDSVNHLIDINLSGMMNSCHTALQMMNSGFIYTMEGFGSNDMMTSGMTIYGTTKRALTYFTKSLTKEVKGSDIKVGLLSPGMVATDFIKEEATKEGSSTSNIFNILGDKPDNVAQYLGSKILKNNKNNAHIKWLTNIKAAYRFMTAAYQKKRKLFD
ncbi:MAG: SDR family oxidoreductase [Clostridiales bacterium]|nr:SDR family oxidoreductase [Clostridiales bacterium]